MVPLIQTYLTLIHRHRHTQAKRATQHTATHSHTQQNGCKETSWQSDILIRMLIVPHTFSSRFSHVIHLFKSLGMLHVTCL